jgi:hypothetical protein
MEVPFTKMQGLGNDFVLFDGLRSPLCLTPEQVCRIADRRLGIGCDQGLLLEPGQGPKADARYRIFNADGKEVEQCGNGSRCVARCGRGRIAGWSIIHSMGGWRVFRMDDGPRHPRICREDRLVSGRRKPELNARSVTAAAVAAYLREHPTGAGSAPCDRRGRFTDRAPSGRFTRTEST